MKCIKRDLRKARSNVEAEIAANAARGRLAAAMASEGYAGGYQAALDDVLLSMNGVYPNGSRYWPRPRSHALKE